MARQIPIEEIIEPHPHNRRRPPISKTHPHLNAEWYFEKNCGLGPEDFSAGSDVAPWWRCLSNQKHVWQASIWLRASKDNKCPYCSGRRVSKDNCLGKRYPRLAEEWHPTKNKMLKPTDFTAYSRQSVWWRCPTCEHEWKTGIGNRSAGETECYRCAKNILDLRNYSYAMRYFDKKKNVGLDPTRLTMHLKLHWKCSKGEDHVWCQTFTKKCSPDRFCPYCSNRKPSITNCLSALHPDLAQEWDRKRNKKLTPDMVTAVGGARVWWLCSKCGRSWRATAFSRSVRKTGCPECWKNNRQAVMQEVGKRNRIPQTAERKIGKLYQNGTSQSEIARRMGVNMKTVHRVLLRTGLYKCSTEGTEIVEK